MRAALLILLGLVIGIIGTVFGMNALHEHSNQLPHAVMVVMGHHMDTLQHAHKAQRCEAQSNLDQLQLMRATTADIGDAFPDAPKEFNDAADRLRAALGTAVQSAPVDCPALAATLKPVGEACENCHQKYR